MKPVQNSGTLPIICEAITSVTVGSICARSKLQKGLDSYQDDDLNRLRARWSNALKRRHEYLDDQIKRIMDKQGKFLLPWQPAYVTVGGFCLLALFPKSDIFVHGAMWPYGWCLELLIILSGLLTQHLVTCCVHCI